VTASDRARPLGPGATIGVLGGGQLGRMMAVAARQMGYRIIVLDPSARCPTAQVSDGVVVGALDDAQAARHLASQVDVITLDTEHVPADVLAELEPIAPVRPNASVLRTIQDRLVQKQFLDRIGLPQANWAPADDVHAALAKVGRPAILKVRRAGYDGKGQVRIDPETDLGSVWQSMGGELAILEAFVDFQREISVVIARGFDGAMAMYVPVENQHRNHILDTTIAPARITPAIAVKAEAIARHIAQEIKLIGLLAVEMFVTRDGDVLVNELAPRPHNSGHLTIDACMTSQFEQQLRAICGLPPGSVDQFRPAAMVNLLGDLWAAGEPDWMAACLLPHVRLHLYGKSDARPGRKMGHITALAPNADEALTMAVRARSALTR